MYVASRIQGSKTLVCVDITKTVKNRHKLYYWLCQWGTVLLSFSVALVFKQDKLITSYVRACSSVTVSDLQENSSLPELAYCLY